ncbi:class A beta-lactamase [Streptomyces sp. ITFR-16]|uniref:class A beta-lactamase n=1 Tax=Streptomyces sp. ITFR-16 TaxID=3075198 RepID=UPI00288C4500|nr:class A beta-lactamase [Streptomyces sp. ITFR-16]WNI24882.1 class A beta-lactamase [Streptomyces sp. ITFR-16]
MNPTARLTPAAPAPTRRRLLTLGGAGAAGALFLAAGPARAARASDATTARLRELERAHGARVGAYAYNLATGVAVRHRSDERFPMLSTFKTFAAAAVLRGLDRDGEVLDKVVHYTEADLVSDSPVTGTEENVARGMSVARLCDAALCDSDNTAGNLLLRELGGPGGVTRFARSLGDRVTRLDRWEPELNSAEPGRITDTTSPASIARDYARLVLGDALERRDRERLTGWLLNCRTSGTRFRAGLPPEWTVADKTGGGSYASCNDVGVAWTPDGVPVVLAVLTTKPAGPSDATGDHPLVREAAAALAAGVVS